MPQQPPSAYNTLSAAPVITHQRRRRRDSERSRRRPQRSRQREETDPLFSSLTQLSDTHIAFLTLKSAWPGEARQLMPETPPVILMSQLRALLSDGNTITQEVRRFVREGIARCVRLPGNEVGLVPYDEIEIHIEGCDAFFLPSACEEWGTDAVLPDHVVNELVGEKGITPLIQAGWLLLRDENSYWMTVPKLGAFSKNRKSGNAELLKLLKKARYKEMSEKELQERTLKNSCFTAQWHVRDLVGSGKVQAVHTSEGVIIRLAGRS